MRILFNEKGASSFKVYVFFIFLFLVIHVGVKLVPMYMDAERLKDEMTAKAGVAQVLRDDEIIKDLVNKANELGLPLTQDSFILQRNEETRRMTISTKAGWDVELTFLWGVYVRTFHFDPVVEESFMNPMR